MSGSANNTPFILHVWMEGFAFNVIKVGFGLGLIIVAVNPSLPTERGVLQESKRGVCISFR